MRQQHIRSRSTAVASPPLRHVPTACAPCFTLWLLPFTPRLPCCRGANMDWVVGVAQASDDGTRPGPRAPVIGACLQWGSASLWILGQTSSPRESGTSGIATTLIEATGQRVDRVALCWGSVAGTALVHMLRSGSTCTGRSSNPLRYTLAETQAWVRFALYLCLGFL